MIEKRNAKRMPSVYYARHMRSGLAGGYKTKENPAGDKYLIDDDCIKRIAPSFTGCPVYVFHREVDIENLQATADGYVTDSFYNESDGWLWVKIIVVSDQGYDAVNKGWGVSNAYLPKEMGDGGTHHGIDFDKKILDADFTHLAIVPDPRYEGAKIFTSEQFREYQQERKKEIEELRNSKERKPMKLFKFLQKEDANLSDDPKEVFVELQNGKSVCLADMIAAVENAADEDKKEEKANMGMKVNVGNKTMTVKELMQRYNEMVEKQNEYGEDEKENESEEDEKENADEYKAEEKKNSQSAAKQKSSYEELKNAHRAADSQVKLGLDIGQLKRGQTRYGSIKQS